MPPRLAPLCLAFTAMTAVVGVASADARAGVPPYTLDERARAVAAPALVFVEAHVSGFMRAKATGEALHTEPILVVSRCSGFVVSAEGHAVTATHCLQPGPDSLRGAASFTLANRLIKDGVLAAEQKATYIKDLETTAEFTGSSPGSAPPVKVYGQLFSGSAGLTAVPAV